MIRITGITGDPIDVYFYGLYGPRISYPTFGPIERPSSILYWSALARARVHVKRRTTRN